MIWQKNLPVQSFVEFMSSAGKREKNGLNENFLFGWLDSWRGTLVDCKRFAEKVVLLVRIK